MAHTYEYSDYGVAYVNSAGNEMLFRGGLTRVGAKRVAKNMTKHSAKCADSINAVTTYAPVVPVVYFPVSFHYVRTMVIERI